MDARSNGHHGHGPHVGVNGPPQLFMLGMDLVAGGRHAQALPLLRSACAALAADRGVKRVDWYACAALLGLLTVCGPPQDDEAADAITSTAAALARKIAGAIDAE
jgi:hypothetical protein